MSAYEPYPPPTPHAGGPTPIAASDLLASRWRRFFALLLDVLILVGPIFTLGFLFGFFEDTTGYTEEELDGIGGLLVLLCLVLYVFVYLPVLMSREGAHNGQTLGKQALGVRVVTAEGVPVTYGRTLRRELLGNFLIAWVTLYLYSIVDYAFGLFDSRRQCLHDKIGSTYVINEEIPFGDGRPVLPGRFGNAPGPYVPPPYGQPAPPYGQPAPPYGPPAAPHAQPAPPYGQPAQPYGQRPAPPYGQQPAEPQHRSQQPPAPQPAPPFGSYPSTLYKQPQEEPADEPRYPRVPGADAGPGSAPERPATPRSPLTARSETAQQSWTPPRRPAGDGNDAARRAFGDDR